MPMDNGVFYDKFITMHPTPTQSGYGEYALNGEYNTFTAIIGIGRTHTCGSDGSGSVIFTVKVDNIAKYTSGVISTGQDTEISVDVTDGNVLKIEANPTSNGHGCDIATYANPVLTTTCTGKWALLLRQKIDSANPDATTRTGYFPQEFINTLVNDEDDPTSDTFSIVGCVDSASLLNSDNRYQFRLTYSWRGSSELPNSDGATYQPWRNPPGTPFDQIWTQASFMDQENIVGSDIYLKTHWSGQEVFKGLGKVSSNPNLAFDGNGNFGWNFGAVGSTMPLYHEGLPVQYTHGGGSGTYADEAEVYVCIQGGCDTNSETIAMACDGSPVCIIKSEVTHNYPNDLENPVVLVLGGLFVLSGLFNICFMMFCCRLRKTGKKDYSPVKYLGSDSEAQEMIGH
eukprot:CAMPEP_0201582012 /NCGR_PEP_ID=MMETSP0190_2-20130828/78829_1 /ASSEMBLY_ACC=CAM_ASM_000263 /TAXON_ID=37353 /ORGANISM="Rosalina sp." /LENGTH=398 /DNA_ID=CAMNT_0048021103 /DNA_START=419 /DNA_END=1615 /DNA_ORIENTATION=+